MIQNTITLPFGLVTDISPDIKLVLNNAGHILGSATSHLHIGEGLHNIVYTGDFKFAKTKLFDETTWNYPRVETLIMESTYGGKADMMPSREQMESNLVNSINATLKEGGKVLIDNQNIKDVSLSSLRKNIALVSQDVILFDDTVENNVRYAKLNATKDEITKACKLAAADEFIKNLPLKYNTLIGENGVRLSGGEKQRLSIARAILKNSPIVLLDEATSSLDSESEAKVQNGIFNLTQNKTTLVIAHRFSTINKADKIILLNQGNVIATGTHDELLKNSKEYKNLYQKQIVN